MIGDDIYSDDGLDFDEVSNLLYLPGRDCYIQTNALGAACLYGNLAMINFILPQIEEKQINFRAVKIAAKTPI